jgi:isopentenyl-diphosphate delta-isomerase
MEQRKKDHIRICLEKDIEVSHSLSGFDNYSFIHNAIPEINKNDITLETKFLGHSFDAPLIISSMTGGTSEARKINRNLATVAQKLNNGMALGSCRILHENPSVLNTFYVRDIAPDIFLCANIGAVQLNYGFGIKECEEIIELVKADALILHLNPLQEALQPEGDTNFKELLSKIEHLCKNLSVPVIAKEVGCGISYDASCALKKAGVDAIDVAGLGGTSFALIERHRAANNIGETFKEWGIPTTAALKQVRKAGLPLIGSGGIRNGLDAAKAIALGADIVGIALPLLKAATKSQDDVIKCLNKIIDELKTAMFCVGAQNIGELQKSKLVKVA